MMWCGCSPTKGLALNLGCFVFGATLFAIGAHYSFKNIGPQQARIQARSELLRAHLIKKFGKDVIPKVFSNPPNSRSNEPGSLSNQQSSGNT